MSIESEINHNFLGRPEGEEKFAATDYELLPGREFVESLTRDISHARRSVDLQFHAYEADAVGSQVADALRDAKRRGIWVRFVVDHFSDLKHSDHFVGFPVLNRLLGQENLISELKNTSKVFHELENEGVFVKRINPLGILNTRFMSRDHKKIAVIDGQETDGVAYLGGINITDHNISWRDFMVRMTGDVVPVVQYDFEATAMDLNGGSHRRKFSDGEVVTDAIGDPKILSDGLKLIDEAHEEILLESPYLWGSNIRSVLKGAASRGVNVVVLVSNKLGARFVPTRGDLVDLDRAGVNVYQYKGPEPMFHSRLLVADNTTVIGSNPFNEFTNGRVAEISVFSKDPNLREGALSMITTDIYHSEKFSAA